VCSPRGAFVRKTLSCLCKVIGIVLPFTFSLLIFCMLLCGVLDVPWKMTVPNLSSRFCLINAGVLYLYFSSFQQIDEEEYGGTWELTKEGFMTSFALFLVTSLAFVKLVCESCW